VEAKAANTGERSTGYGGRSVRWGELEAPCGTVPEVRGCQGGVRSHPRKIYERAEFVRQCPDTGVVVFEMDRHQSVLGAENRPGSGMHSFMETRHRYTFNPAGGGSMEESRTDDSPKLRLDTRSAAEEYARNLGFEFEHLGGRRYRCTESCSNGSWEVSGRREAVGLAEVVAEEVYWDHDVECLSLELDAPLSPDMEQEIVDDLHNDFVEIVREMLADAWDSFMKEHRS
jgi:hypothetical protein